MALISKFNLILAKYHLISPQDLLNEWDAQDVLC